MDEGPRPRRPLVKMSKEVSGIAPITTRSQADGISRLDKSATKWYHVGVVSIEQGVTPMAIETAARPQLTEERWPPQGQWTYGDYKRLPQDGWRYEVTLHPEVHHARR
jgi:hypothetical protein